MDNRTLIDGATGTIGTPITKFTLKPDIRKEFDIEEVIIHKFTPKIEHVGTLERFHQMGAKLAVDESKYDEFVRILRHAGHPFKPDFTYEEALKRVNSVVDCTKDGEGLKNKEKYYVHHENHLLVIIGQGSERKGDTMFGFPYAFGHNDDELDKKDPRYRWIMSCNDHSILANLHTITAGYSEIENLISARFGIERRGADMVNEKINIGPEVGEGNDTYFGSHQAEDAMILLSTKDIGPIDIHSTANKQPHPFMHVMNVEFRLRHSLTREEIIRRFRENPLTSITYHTKVANVFVEGNIFGATGRINTQSILACQTISIPRPGEIRYSCFTPQDGNSLLSSFAALVQKLDPEHWREKTEKIFRPYLEQFTIV